LKLKLSHYIYTILITFSFDGFLAQDLSLKLASKNKNDILILNNIEYQNKHADTVSIQLELQKIATYLKHIGYFTNSLDSIKKHKTNYIGYFTLNDKIDNVILKIAPDLFYLFNDLESGNISLPIHELKTTLLSVSKKLDTEGKSFSKIKLSNINIENKSLFADLDIHQSKKRYLDKVIVKGYEKFPRSFLKNHFSLHNKTIFNQLKINQTSNLSKNIPFIEEIKPPEVLFTKDSTKLYLYFKKRLNNSFDGIVNFASKENGGVLFNGNIDLKLNNTLNKGEKFELFWNSIAEERQEFKLSTEIPYILNSKFTPKISFSIYRQDSTFLNTTFNSELFFNLNPKVKIALTYNSETSENLEENINSTIATYKNMFLGFKLIYRIPKEDFFFNDKFYFQINPTIGKRNTNLNASNQFKIEGSTSVIWDLNLRNSFYIRNTTGYLNSDTFLDNELFRIGGANSIRGFNEQSIFTNSYTYFNAEYRYLTSNKSYLYTITDIGKATSNTLIGIGLGYSFSKGNSIININSVLPNSTNTKSQLSNIQLIINWTSFF
tara:strand:+ start:39493 stop:41139 length:1647 start_codon:yes stop_codon:yes gene_type:complete